MKVAIFLVFCFVGAALGQERRCPANMIQLFNGVACSSDSMCYTMAPGYFCLNGYCCANSASSPSGYGASCTYQSQCNFANSQCLNNICYCASGYDYDGYQCRGGSTVSSSNICGENEVQINNQCYRIANYFDNCLFEQQCASIDGVCRDFKCMCDTGNVFNGFQCVFDPDFQSSILSGGLNCRSDEVPINNKCYPSLRRGQACYYTEQCNLEGGLECRDGICQDKIQSSCGSNQVLINGRCYTTSLPGGTCQYDQQCTDPHSRKPQYCGGGICRWVFSGNPTCRNPGSLIERINGVVKNCLYQDCSFGYQCEYNQAFNNGQYICCGSGGGGNGNQPGQIKFYPGTSMPLECRAINACIFVDYPHCVYSQRYGYQVCCSTKNCY